MTVHAPIPGAAAPAAPAALREAAFPDGLAAIAAPDCAAILWRRAVDPGFQAWIDALPADRLPRTRTILTPHMVRDAALAACENAGLPEWPERAVLADDIAALAHVFAGATGAAWLQMRLETVEDDSCRRFHVDNVTARLVCTYRGPGTEFGLSADGGAPAKVLRAPTGSPLIMRGKRWREDPPAGFLHRSPPIEGAGITRLLLALDPAAPPREGA